MKKIVVAAAVAALFAAPAGALAASCTDALGSNSFDCTHLNELNAPYTSCMKFTTPGSGAEIDLVMSESLVFSGGCSCSAKGSPTAATFDVGTSFQCVVNSGAGYLALGGKAAGGKIKKGHATSATGFSSVFTCVQRATPCP